MKARTFLAIFGISVVGLVLATSAGATPTDSDRTVMDPGGPVGKTSSTATITLNGSVHCTRGYVEGVWLEVGTGNSNWTTMGNEANTVKTTTWRRTFTASLPTNIRLHVGCDGSRTSWWSDNRTPSSSRTIGSISGSRSGLDAYCNDGSPTLWPDGKPPSTGDNVRCSWGTKYPSGLGNSARLSGQYSGDNAACEFGSAGGTSCTNPNNARDKYDWGYYYSGSWHLLSPLGFNYRNCTDYAAWRVGSLSWSSFGFSGSGNAANWGVYPNYSHAGFTETRTPHIGDIAWWDYHTASEIGRASCRERV